MRKEIENSDVPLLVSTEWLGENLSRAKNGAELRILQAVYPDHCYSPDLIPNAILFEGAKCQTKSLLHNQMPNPEQFAKYVGEHLGIRNDTHVIVYDASAPPRTGLEAGPRLWYTFRIFGHNKVSLLNGGLAKWQKEKRTTTTKQLTNISLNEFEVKQFRSELIVDYEKMCKIRDSQSHHVLDSRSESRFAGIDPEPAGGKSGKIENTENLPFTKLINPETLEFLDMNSLKRLFGSVGVDHSKPFMSTCGTGTTACGLNLANDLLGHDIGGLYDGSWFEYSRKIGVNPWPKQ